MIVDTDQAAWCKCDDCGAVSTSAAAWHAATFYARAEGWYAPDPRNDRDLLHAVALCPHCKDRIIPRSGAPGPN